MLLPTRDKKAWFSQMYHVEISSNVLKWVIYKLSSSEVYIGAHIGVQTSIMDVVEHYQITPSGEKHFSSPAYWNVTCWQATAKSLSWTLPRGSAFLKDALLQGVNPHLMSDPCRSIKIHPVCLSCDKSKGPSHLQNSLWGQMRVFNVTPLLPLGLFCFPDFIKFVVSECFPHLTSWTQISLSVCFPKNQTYDIWYQKF